jgi:hypothetical protein
MDTGASFAVLMRKILLILVLMPIAAPALIFGARRPWARPRSRARINQSITIPTFFSWHDEADWF